MTAKSYPPFYKIKRCVAYNPETSAMVWCDRPVSDFTGKKVPAEVCWKIWTSKTRGRPAFVSPNASGHRAGRFDGVTIYAHHVVWAFEHGDWPRKQINHIDGDPGNNRISNLREVSQKLVTRNQKIHKHNKSGIGGVFQRSDTRKWVGKIGRGEGMVYLGCFDTKEEAAMAVDRAKSERGYTSEHGRRK